MLKVRLDGRVALVTGGSTGIGLAIAVRMAASGADVAMLARRAGALDEARTVVQASAKGRMHVVPCDVSRADEVARAYGEVLQAFGRVDIPVNSAGSLQTGAFISILDEECRKRAPLRQRCPVPPARRSPKCWRGRAVCSRVPGELKSEAYGLGLAGTIPSTGLSPALFPVHCMSLPHPLVLRSCPAACSFSHATAPGAVRYAGPHASTYQAASSAPPIVT